MGIDTDLNQSPYYDDFNEEKNFHRVLFRPGVAVQARELTQLQSILQNQIERFGSNILREGTIVSGCSFTEVKDIQYVKVLDLTVAGQPVSMNNYLNTKAIGISSGVEARVQLVATGLETQSPDLNTLFVKYTGTGTLGAKVFSSTENIQIRNASTNELIATLTVAGNVDAEPTGKSYALRCQDGVIYQKGHFVRVDSQLITVSKYTRRPDNLVVGFQTTEEIINSNNDTSLLDNANGYNNFNAPGADRLKLSPDLVVKTLAEAEADEEFFALQEYNLGRVVRKNPLTQYDGILRVMEERTKEESGNYVVKGMEPGIVPNVNGNTDLLSVTVSRGTAYVEGIRVNLLDTIDIDLPKATEFLVEENQNVSQTIGNYILVDTFAGDFEPNKLPDATLYNANTGGSAIGSAKIRAVEHHSGTVGSSSAQYRIYLFDIKMNSSQNWTSTKSIRYTGGSVSASAQLISTRRYDSNLSSAVYSLGRSAVKKLPAQGTNFDFIRRTQQDVILTNTSTSISSITANEWPYGDGVLSSTQKLELLLIPQTTNAAGGYTAGTPVDLSSATVTVSGSGTSMEIAGLSAPDASVTFTLMHNEKLIQSAPAGKDLETIYVKIDTDTHTNGITGPWTLGVPDVYSIENVWVNNGSYAETNDKKSFFNLLSGRWNAYYNLSSIKRKNITLSSGDNLLVKLKVFRKNTGGSNGPAVFTIDSYPIDDANTANTAAIQTQNIPLDRGDDGRTIIDLRNAVDLRPQAANTATYAATAGAATENPSSTVTFADTDQYTLAPNQYFESDYEYYLARKDFFMLDEKGKFVIVQGEPDANPAPPSEPTKGMVLARIEVSPYPSLDPRTASLLNKNNQGTKIVKRNNRRYTMRDISGIEKRITNLEYYTTLNAIETSAKDLVITDADGLNRFKNGIFADGFKDLSGSDVRNIEFSAALSPSGQGIQARTKMVPLDLTRHEVSESNIDVYPKFGAITLDETSTQSIINQPYASKFRNCVTDFYKFNGKMFISPPYDSGFDNTRAPNAQFTVDTATPIIELVELIHEFQPLTKTSTDVVRLGSTREVDVRDEGNRTTTTTTTTTTNQITTTTEGITTSTIEREKSIGEFVTDVSLSPFIRPKTIFFVVFGLRPNTDHYVYFDKIDVSNRCGTAESTNDDVDDIMEYEKTSRRNTQLTSDSNGTIRGFFDIPEGTFYNGDRELAIHDVQGNILEIANASTSGATVTYNAFNFSTTTSELTMLTREVEFERYTDIRVNTETDVDTRVQVTVDQDENDPPRDNDDNSRDPIAQTFRITKNNTRDSVVMLSKMDLFFNRKDSNLGLDVEIRDVVNGYPGSKILGATHLKSTEITANNTSANNATTVDFKVPVPLSVGKDYCFAVLPDANSPEYLIYVNETGGTDIDTNVAVTQDSHDGTLFYATNNKAWTAIQNENIKFNLYKGQYASSGSAGLKFKAPEFLNIEVVGNTLPIGEKVAVLNANAAGTLAVNSSSTSVTGTSVDFTYLNANDWIAYYANTTVIDVVKISSVDSANNTLTLTSKPRFSNTAVNYFKTVKGNLAYFDGTDKYILELSSADTGTTIYDNGSSNTTINNYFTANDTVFSAASVGPITGTITEVLDQNVSYIQPNIYKSNTTRTKTPFYLNTIRNTSYTNYATSNTSFKLPTNDMTYLNSTKSVVPSWSNMKANSIGGQPFSIYYTPQTNVSDSTPIIDYEISNCFLHEYIINNDVTNEETPTQLGNASTRWISKTAVLGEGFEADDMSLFITAYRPPTTDIKVYVKFQNGSDPRDLDDIYWTPLDIKPGTNSFSSPTNFNDYRELEYSIPSVANAAALTNDGAAKLLEDNEYNLFYKDDSGIIYSKYSIFKIKVVMTSTDGHKLSPIMKDIRAIALS